MVRPSLYPKTRRFNGEVFRLKSIHVMKTMARSVARDIRLNGGKARMVKLSHSKWGVYWRKT